MTPEHQSAQQRFILPTQPICELDYELDLTLQPARVTFTHTLVPQAHAGQGLAAQLVQAGLTWARAQGLKVVPQCSYVARYIERHPEWNDLV